MVLFHELKSWLRMRRRKRARNLPFNPKNTQGRGTAGQIYVLLLWYPGVGAQHNAQYFTEWPNRLTMPVHPVQPLPQIKEPSPRLQCMWLQKQHIVVKYISFHKDTKGHSIPWSQVGRFRGVPGVWPESLRCISDDQLGIVRDMEYGSVIRKTKHSRLLPISSAINLWLGDLRGIYGRDKSRGLVPRGSRAVNGATPAWDSVDCKQNNFCLIREYNRGKYKI